MTETKKKPVKRVKEPVAPPSLSDNARGLLTALCQEHFGLPANECRDLIRHHAKMVKDKRATNHEKNGAMLAIAEFLKADIAIGKLVVDEVRAEQGTRNNQPIVNNEDTAQGILDFVGQHYREVETLPIIRPEPVRELIAEADDGMMEIG